MSIVMTSYRCLRSEIYRATDGYGQSGAQRTRHRMKRRRSAKIKRHRTHPRPPVPRKTAVIQISNSQQAADPANTKGIKSP